MDNRAEIREFPTTRRAKITPGQAGLKLLASWSAAAKAASLAPTAGPRRPG